jgi:hypothetical protein
LNRRTTAEAEVDLIRLLSLVRRKKIPSIACCPVLKIELRLNFNFFAGKTYAQSEPVISILPARGARESGRERAAPACLQ